MQFWNFFNSKEKEIELVISGEISSHKWWGDETTPKEFLSELKKHESKDITVWINSPGGDVVAASQIYTALINRKGKVLVKIDGIAASAASVIAMAGEVHMSPTALIMIHNPWTVAFGDAEEMKHTAEVLNEVKETLINAYQLKTGKDRKEISALMNSETWMSSKTAIELGFADFEIESKQKAQIPVDKLKAYWEGQKAIWNCAYNPKREEKEKEPAFDLQEHTNESEDCTALAVFEFIKTKIKNI